MTQSPAHAHAIEDQGQEGGEVNGGARVTTSWVAACFFLANVCPLGYLGHAVDDHFMRSYPMQPGRLIGDEKTWDRPPTPPP